MMDIEQEVRTACIRQLSFPLPANTLSHTQLHALTVPHLLSPFSYSQVDGITGRTRDTTKCDIGMSTRRQASEISTRRPSTCGSTRDLTARSTARSSCSSGRDDGATERTEDEVTNRNPSRTLSRAGSAAAGLARAGSSPNKGRRNSFRSTSPVSGRRNSFRMQQSGRSISPARRGSFRGSPSPTGGRRNSFRAAGQAALISSSRRNSFRGSPNGGRRQSIMGGGRSPSPTGRQSSFMNRSPSTGRFSTLSPDTGCATGHGTGRSTATQNAYAMLAMDLAAAEDELEKATRAKSRAESGLQRVDKALRKLLDKGTNLSDKSFNHFSPNLLHRRGLRARGAAHCAF